MSNHSSTKRILLKYNQIEARKKRRQEKRNSRLAFFLDQRGKIKAQVLLDLYAVTVIMFLWLVAFIFITVVYTGWIVGNG